MTGNDPRYGLDELAELGGVSRRTVRYYIQEDLLPAPYGVGRGPHYGPEHLDALLRVRSLQEAGRTLDEIRRPAAGRERRRSVAAPTSSPAVTAWRRIALTAGVELHVSSDARLPSAAALETLADWCRANLSRGDEDRNADD